jgi:hypothetical protein
MASEIVYQALEHKGGLRLLVIGRGPVRYVQCPARPQQGQHLVYRPDRDARDLNAMAQGILADMFGEEGGLELAPEFATQVIALLPADGWELYGSEILAWLQGKPWCARLGGR